MWMWWSLPALLVAVLIGLRRAGVAVHARITGPVARARRLARGTTAITDGEVVTIEGLALAESHAAAAQLYRDGATRFRIIAHPVHPLTIGRR